MTSARDSQSWSEIRMTIRRVGEQHMLATVIHRTVAGQKVWDRRLDTASVDLSLTEGAESDLHLALAAALEALRRQRL